MGMFPNDVATFSSAWIFRLSLNIITPIVLMGIGLVLPYIAKKTNKEKNI